MFSSARPLRLPDSKENYFDDISIFTSSGPMSLTSGNAVTMVNDNGATLATPVTLTDYAFKVVYAAA